MPNPDLWVVVVPDYFESSATTTSLSSISSNIWYWNQTANPLLSNQTSYPFLSNQTSYPFLSVATSQNETGPLYNVIVTQSTMFTPTGYGIYYHNIPATFSLTRSLPAYDALRPPRPRLARPALLRGRRALRRSIDLFRMLRPTDEVRAFLSGDPVIIHGQRYDYRVQKRDNLLYHTMHPHSPHIPYKLELLDKNGRYLAQGCTVIRNTPVIDQLVALILHIEHDESVVLNNTNWTPPLSLPMAA
jgi:hypothetical protein